MKEDLVFEIDGLDKLSEDLRKAEHQYPAITRKYVQKAGSAFRKDVSEQTRAVTRTRSGRLAKGYRVSVQLQSGSLHAYEAQVRGGMGKAHHFHLVEHGHEGKVPDRSGQMHNIGRVAGRHMMERTRNNWNTSGKLIPFAQKALDEALKQGGLL